MKTKFLLLAVAALPMIYGCANANSEPASPPTNVVVLAETNAVAATEPAATNAIPAEQVPAGQPVNTNWVAPATVKLSPGASEIAKLAQAGVDQSVMLTFINNSPNTFRLEADDIVYLNDIGLPPEVVSAMINRDQQLRQGSNGTAVAAASTPSVWSAGQVTNASNVWQQTVAEPAPAAQAQDVATLPPPPPEERPQEVTVNYFYDSLAPYGTWIDIDGYGRCWRPTVVATYAGWRPYCHGGRWVWTDAGWYWYSDYSWGWAPFHYGRWFSHPRWGWCWMPGSVWGPAWVSWRYSDDYCGWAPLPPAAYYSPSFGFSYYGSSCGSSFSFGLGWNSFTFISYRHFHSRRYDRDCVPHHHAGNVYNNTTVVNNIIRGNNNTIINQGVAPTRITAVSGTPIRQATIRETRPPRDLHTARHETIAQDGSTLQIVRGNVPAPEETTGPDRHPRVGTTRGGSQGLVSGNNAVATPAAPAPTRNNGPTRVAPIRENLNPTTSSSSTVAQPAAPAQNATAAPAAGNDRGNGGPRRLPPVRDIRTGTTANTATEVTPSATTTSPTVSSGPSRNTRDDKEPTGPRSIVIRTPRGQSAASTPSANNPSSSATGPTRVTPAAPSAPAVATTQNPAPQTPRNDRSQATPWLNNQNNNAAPAQAPQVTVRPNTTWQSAPSRNDRNEDVRSTPNFGRRYAPDYTSPSAPSTRSAPVQTPSTPRSFGAPAPPQPAQTYTPPVRSAPAPSQPSYSPPARSTPPSSAPSYTPPARTPPPSQPSYSPPARSERPSYSPPPSRSESRSESRGSDRNTREERSSRGR